MKKSLQKTKTKATALAPRIDRSKALELRFKKGLSFKEIGNYFGVSEQAVHQSLKAFKNLLSDDADIKALRVSKTELLDVAELTLLNDLVEPERRKAASLNNVAYALQNVNNMNRLEKGQSTANIQYIDLTESLESIRREKQQLIDELGIQ